MHRRLIVLRQRATAKELRSWVSYRRLCARLAYLRGSRISRITYPLWDALNSRFNTLG